MVQQTNKSVRHLTKITDTNTEKVTLSKVAKYKYFNTGKKKPYYFNT